MFSKGPHGCPRGFKWCDKKQECIPDGIVPADRLEQRYQRYFFKEDITMEDIDKLVDEVFAGGFDHFGKTRKAEKKIDRLLDNLKTTGRPYDHPLKMKVVSTVDGDAEVDVEECAGPLMDGEKEGFEGSKIDDGEQASKDDNPQKVSNDINHVPNQNVHGLKKSIHAELGEQVILKVVEEAMENDDYKIFLSLALEEYGYRSPSDIPEEKRLDFFASVDAAWTVAEASCKGPMKEEDEEIEEFIERPRDDRPRGGFGSIGGTRQSGGFGSIKGRPQK